MMELSSNLSNDSIFTIWYVCLKGALKPFFGIRLASGICPPSKWGLVVLPERFFAPLRPLQDVLPWPEPEPRPLRFVGLVAPRGEPSSFIFMRSSHSFPLAFQTAISSSHP